MRQEFIYTRGKIIVENDLLLIKHTEKRIVSGLPFQVLMILAITGLFVQRILDNSWIIGTFFVGAFSIMGLIVLYDLLKNNHFSNTIPLNKISSYAVKPGGSELEMDVILSMRSGRYKTIPFRTLEKQHEEFAGWLSLQTGVTKMV